METANPEAKTPTTRPKLLDELETLTRERYPEGLAVRLKHRFHAQGLDTDVAVGDAIEIMVKKADTLQVEDARARSPLPYRRYPRAAATSGTTARMLKTLSV